MKERDIEEHSHAPAPILVRVVEQVADHLKPLLHLEPHSAHVAPNDEPGNEEHRPTILARPVAALRLELLEEAITIARRLERVRRGREVGEANILAEPVLVVGGLWPGGELVVGTKVVPRVVAVGRVAEAPAGVVRERELAGKPFAVRAFLILCIVFTYQSR